MMLLGLMVVHALHLSADDMDLKERPVTKIVNILKQMQADLEKEKAEDEELYDKLACWCETVGKDKAADIQEMVAKSQTLESEIKQLEKEIAENDAALRKADEMRQKELAEFNKNEKELLQSIQ